MPRGPGLRVSEVNPYLVCTICDGYLVDATTIIECLHSFCRTCIVRYLESSNFCPVCDVQVHKTRPLLSIRSDQTLQDLVYKLVPGLYQNEMQKRQEFYAEHPKAAVGCFPEERGESDPRFISLQETISIALQHRSRDSKPMEEGEAKDPTTRYLSCPAGFTVAHLKKFLRLKFCLPLSLEIDIFHDEHLLTDDYTLMDVAYIFSWKRAGPMTFLYSISKYAPKALALSIPLSPPCAESTEKQESAPKVDTPAFDFDAPISEELRKAETELQKVVIVDPIAGAPAPDALGKTLSEKISNTELTKSVSSTKDHLKMDVDIPKSNSSPPGKPVPLPLTEPTYNSVKLVSAPEMNTLLSPTNGIRLKFTKDPELNPKSQKLKKSGRKGNKSSRHKSVPARLARLAPYPTPPVPPSCLTTQPLQHIPQIAMGKLVPTVITTLSPTIITTTLVSTASSTLCNATRGSNSPHVAPFMNHPITCNVSSITNNLISSISNLPDSNIQSSTTTPNSSSSYQVNSLNSVSSQNSDKYLRKHTKELSDSNLTILSIRTSAVPSSAPIPVATVTTTQQLTTPVAISPKSDISMSTPLLYNSPGENLLDSESFVTKNSDASFHIVHPPIPVTLSTEVVESMETVTSSTFVERLEMNAVPIENKSSERQVCEPMDTDFSIENTEKNILSVANNRELMFDNSIDKKSESFKMSVKNSISAEFSDNEDLGCPPDLVVDEQKMDSSDNEDDADAALRKKITAIAEKEDEMDVADDAEADSGVSCAARSEDDADSLRTCETSGSTVTARASVLAAPSQVSNTTDDIHRQVKSNNINDVIENLYKQHERVCSSSSASQLKVNSALQCAKKDDTGVLDLSTCTRKPGECLSTRQRPVANPVLDIKHRQQTYLPAPLKQHTACAPAPKHNSSPLLRHHLTGSSSILHAQLTANSKSTRHPAPFSSANASFSVSRPVSTPSPLSGRGTPNSYSHKLSPGHPHPSGVNLLSGIIPYASMMNLANYANRNNMSLNLPLPNRTTSNSFTKDVPTTASKISFSKQASTYTRKPSDMNVPNSPNGRGSNVSSPSAHPRTSPSMLRMSPHHRSVSPAPSPQHASPTNSLTASFMATATTSSQSKPSIPIYKKQDSLKSYNHHKFKGSNLAVFNPDPNGFRQKIVIKNLDSRSNNHH